MSVVVSEASAAVALPIAEQTAGGVHCGIGDVVVDHAQRRLHHLAAVIDLGDDPVGTVALIGGDGDAGPLDRRVMAGEVGQYIAAAVLVLAGDDDAGLVGVLARANIGRYKRVIGDALRSRTGGRQTTEVAIAAASLNRMLELGRPEYLRLT